MKILTWMPAAKTVVELVRVVVVSTTGGPAVWLAALLVGWLPEALVVQEKAPVGSERGMGRTLCQQQHVARSSQ